MKKPLLWVLILAMSVSLVVMFSSGGCRRVEEPVVEEVTQPSEEVSVEKETLETPPENLNKKLWGVCAGLYRDNEDPDHGIFPTEEELQEDINFLVSLTSSIRTYGVTHGAEKIPQYCQNVDLDCYPGAWISQYKRENEKELKNLIQIGQSNLSCVKGLIVGNEALLRNDVTEDELLSYIERVKSSTNLPVGTAELWQWWLEHPRLAEKVDFILVHIYPYWEGISVEEAAFYVIEKYQEIQKAYPGKRTIIGETGWPSAGDQNNQAIPSEENQKKYLSEFLKLAKENNVEYFYFEAFDENWKTKFEGQIGAHWGIYYSDGSIKPLLEDLVSQEACQEINRPPREVAPQPVTNLPWVIYNEVDSPDNRFFPSGWMGDQGSISFFNEACQTSPHSGNSCIKITFTPQKADNWAGIYWQYPLNNWGEYPGYDFPKVEANKLTFWAKGENGGEKAEFKTGGIKDPDKLYQDSFGPVLTGVVKLTKEWKKYAIDLQGEDLTQVLGGFCWVTNAIQNPDGCTIFLDDIQFEAEIEVGAPSEES